jgi:hypothetical protein
MLPAAAAAGIMGVQHVGKDWQFWSLFPNYASVSFCTHRCSSGVSLEVCFIARDKWV